MTKKVRVAILAAAINIVLFAVMIAYLSIGKEHIVLSILLPAACHISLCGTLIKYLYLDKNNSYSC